MPRSTWTQTNFNGGEWTPLAHGRVDIPKYKNALDTCSNYIPTTQGGLTRRPGKRYVAEVKDSTKKARLQRFEFSISQAYNLEFGPGYVRFYTNDGQLQTSGVAAYNGATAYVPGDLVTSGGTTYYCIASTTGNTPPNATYWYAQTGTIYEIPTPYAEADLFALNFAQSADVLYIAHKGYAPRKLQRLGATKWILSTISFLDGPYLPVNTTLTTLTPSGVSGAVTVTASAAAFAATDVGRVLRIKAGTAWLWGFITGYTDSTHVTWTIAVASGGVAGATTFWRLGLYSSVNGYPGAVTFHQARLFWAGCAQYPSRLDGSNSSDYENMAPTNVDGTAVDSNAVGYSLDSNTVNAIYWMLSDEYGMLVGTSGGEWSMTPSNTQQALTPINVNAKQMTGYGCAQIQPVRVGKNALFVQRTGRKLREMKFQYINNTFIAPDVSLLGEHLTKGGIKQMATTLAPQQVIWLVRNDGLLVAVTYDPDQEVLGWHQHPSGAAGKVESICGIPAPSVDRDELWVLTNYTIDGVTKRYIEVMTKLWEDGDAVEDAFFVDAGATYSGAPTTTVSGLTWLKNTTVSVLADGATHPDVTVNSSGVITLQRAASKVQVGLACPARGKTMRIEAGGAEGMAQGKLKRIHRAIFRLFQTIGHTINSSTLANPDIPEPFRSSADPMDGPIALFTGDKRWSVEGSWETDGAISWSQNDPLPSNILLLSVMLETQDGG